MDEMKCEWSGVKNVARTGIPFIKLDRISVLYAVGLFATFENISFTAHYSLHAYYLVHNLFGLDPGRLVFII